VSATKAHAALRRQQAEYRCVTIAFLRERRELGTRTLHFRMDAARPHRKSSTVFGDEHTSRTPFEERDAELGLQPVNRTRHGRLCTEQGEARAIGAAVIGNREECSQLA
jgi:hypothetical protein